MLKVLLENKMPKYKHEQGDIWKRRDNCDDLNLKTLYLKIYSFRTFIAKKQKKCQRQLCCSKEMFLLIGFAARVSER